MAVAVMCEDAHVSQVGHREERRLQPHHVPQVRHSDARAQAHKHACISHSPRTRHCAGRAVNARTHTHIHTWVCVLLHRCAHEWCWLCTATYQQGHFKQGRCEQFSQDFFEEINLTRDEFEANYVVTNHW